jgi:non-ribosomal peptide synthetase component F
MTRCVRLDGLSRGRRTQFARRARLAGGAGRLVNRGSDTGSPSRRAKSLAIVLRRSTATIATVSSEPLFDPATTRSIAEARQHSVGDLLRRSRLRYPDKLALADAEVRLTFSEFDTAVNRTAHSLRARGLAKGDRLAILSHNCWQFGVLVFAAARAGIILTPVNFMLGPAEIAFILEHSGASCSGPGGHQGNGARRHPDRGRSGDRGLGERRRMG